MTLLALALLAGCGSEPYPDADQYCELTAELFCDYYARCDLIALEGAPCEEVFLETCNDVYEPRYVALEERGLIALSHAGIETCEQHLADVACAEQIFNLQGPCAAVWEGRTEAGGACGLGVESFVCDADSTCVIGLDLCGTCEAAVEVGQSCDEDRCHPGGSCVEGACVERGLPGATCDDDTPCVLGAWCEEGTCTRAQIVGVGQSCDQVHRCAYQSVCADGSCVAQPRLGEVCDAVPCASGWCNGTCVALLETGTACEAGAQCVSGVCGDAGCEALPGVCFP